MKHEYTDTQLRQAVAYFLEDEEADLSVSTLGEFFWTQQVKALRKMLDALPEPATDEWQECRLEDIRKGDQIKYVTEISTVTPHKPVTEIDQGDIIIGNQIRITNRTDAKYYRIPAPVQHPDPAEHPVIIVDTNYGGLKGRHSFVWDGEMYAALNGPIKHANPETITDWTPAKVVEDDR